MFPKLQEIQNLFCILLQQKSSRIIIITLCSSSRRGTHGVIILSLCSSSRNPSNSDQNHCAYAGAKRSSEQQRRLTSSSRLEWREAAGEGYAASGEGFGAAAEQATGGERRPPVRELRTAARELWIAAGKGDQRGSGSRLERRRQPAGKGAGDVDDGGAWRRGGAMEEDDGVLAEGRSEGGRRQPVRFQIGGWGRGSLVISLIFTWSENLLQRQLFRNGGS
uniref:Uncharacterized protein n=4 Tax=Aegilops tauschii subsp. strangulata TaxID=200361 RepID=A0A453L5Q0_AEGTS